jgi:hypothetical protein
MNFHRATHELLCFIIEEAVRRVEDNAPLYENTESDMLARPTIFNNDRIAKYDVHDFGGNEGVKLFFGTIVYDKHRKFWTVNWDETSRLGRTQERLTFHEVLQGLCFMKTENVDHANYIIDIETERVPSSQNYNTSFLRSM